MSQKERYHLDLPGQPTSAGDIQYLGEIIQVKTKLMLYEKPKKSLICRIVGIIRQRLATFYS